ncbi:hypothetical protein Noda2021_03150 [Candidatus Dependentiae bacterium Noda2021]|nr:hypothetical protein Noda2021_03150 [Candidatus Dependentiae bacterium Noda2021]
MKNKIALFISIFIYIPSFGYTKKIEILHNPQHQKKVVIFYDHHNDAQFEEGAKQQINDIINFAKSSSARILIEDIFDYKGTHSIVHDGIEKVKYNKPIFLLRDVADKARIEGLLIENMDYRQEMESSINGKGIVSRVAFQTVEKLIATINSFDDPELRSYYSEFLEKFKILHTDIKKIFDEDKMVSQQLKKSEIGKKLLTLADKIPVTCQIPAHVIMLYDVRIMNLLFIHRIYELQKDLECSNYIFVIAGAFHATEVSDVLQKKLGYNLVDQLPGIGNEIINLNSFLMAHITPEIEKNMLTSLDILLAPLHLLERIV